MPICRALSPENSSRRCHWSRGWTSCSRQAGNSSNKRHTLQRQQSRQRLRKQQPSLSGYSISTRHGELTSRKPSERIPVGWSSWTTNSAVCPSPSPQAARSRSYIGGLATETTSFDNERDIQSAAAELAEVAGWALGDAERDDAAQRFNYEALFLAKLSGDRSIELPTLQNMAMHSEWRGRNQEALSIARSVLNRRRMSARVEAMFRIREAKGLVGTGRTSDAIESLERARSLIEDGNDVGEPEEVWRVTRRRDRPPVGAHAPHRRRHRECDRATPTVRRTRT